MYQYAFDNKRITTIANGSIEDRTWDDNELLETLAENGARISRMAHGVNGRPVAYVDGTGTWRSLVTDLQGSVTGAFDLDSSTNHPLSTARVYDPFGGIIDQTGDGTPVDWLSRSRDPLTGDVDLVNRWYSASRARFASTDRYAYVDQSMPYSMNLYQYGYANPLTYMDRDGLYLVAFDGTWNDKDQMEADPNANPTNIAKLYKVYMGMGARYLRGVGTTPGTKLVGGAFGLGVQNRIEDAFGAVQGYFNALSGRVSIADESTAFDLNIDIIGFSRGATEARTFANKLVREGIYIDDYSARYARRLNEHGHRVFRSGSGMIVIPKIRFLGLFDTVASVGLSPNWIELGHDLSIPDNVESVRQATARDEKRLSFPLSTVLGYGSAPRIVEREFVGVHSDVGGGYFEDTLSTMPLFWMWNEAREAGVPFGDLGEKDRQKFEVVAFLYNERDNDALDTMAHDSRWIIERMLESSPYVYHLNRTIYGPKEDKENEKVNLLIDAIGIGIRSGLHITW